MAKTALTGAAGEYFVAAELSRRWWAASITPRNADRTDVLAQHVDSGRVVALQVKCSSGRGSFSLSVKDEQPTARDNEFFVLTHLEAEDERPRFFVIPRNLVAALIYVDHRRWLSIPAKNGQPHNDNPRRQVRIDDVWIYEDAWALLEQPTDGFFKAPPWFVECGRDFGLPDGHPGLVIPDEKLPGPTDPRKLPARG
jgi:hypothetical protein